ncbi:MAG: hypothetical protein RMX25_022885 [Nostoc sp. DedVER01b]|uniref:hypothetical protein n=2 Tax=unclassified Nostoc TaxID=2593658 RepID=UPI002AD534E2|nr:hypothetical protein [Nostoc sp. DedVER02]MDZ7989257.1 hypothetical protein [Nostoc sp. DedVER02]MDZ8114337.1 hypothetical protein [Nostoc sp. DedVER01b]
MIPENAATAIINATPIACKRINKMSRVLLKTRGGRRGSGMGSLLEALWGFYTNQVLLKVDPESYAYELGWFSDHGYNDFACVLKDTEWNSDTRFGELLRIEAKSMNVLADESKGHFDELIDRLGNEDLLLILIWTWETVNTAISQQVYPHILDYFIGKAQSVAFLRDALHLARGGSFVDRNSCPDGCAPVICKHHGEPLNANGTRERLSGPNSCRAANVSYAANFGGLVRMIKTDSDSARQEFRRIRASDDAVHNYISFIHRNYPDEEVNQYLAKDWKILAHNLGIQTVGLPKKEIINLIKKRSSNYRDQLRLIS